MPGGLRAARISAVQYSIYNASVLPSVLAVPKTFQEPLTQLKVLFSGSLRGTSCEFMFLVAISLYKQFKAHLIARLTVAALLLGSWSQLEQGNNFELAQVCLSLTSSLLA